MTYKIADDVKVEFSESDASVCLSRDNDGTEERTVISGAGPVFVYLLDGDRDMDEVLAECLKIFGPSVEAYNLAQDLDRFIGELVHDGFVTLVKS